MLPTPELLEAFDKLMRYLCDCVAVKLPKPEKPFVLETDASSVAFGGVLNQFDGEEEISTLCFRLGSAPLNAIPAYRSESFLHW